MILKGKDNLVTPRDDLIVTMCDIDRTCASRQLNFSLLHHDVKDIL